MASDKQEFECCFLTKYHLWPLTLCPFSLSFSLTLANVILVLGSERLYSEMVRRFDGTRASTDEVIRVVKLAKSGGCVDRDEAYMKQLRQAQIRDYFFGDAKRTLSPHTQIVAFSQLVIYKVHQGKKGEKRTPPFPPSKKNKERKKKNKEGAIFRFTFSFYSALYCLSILGKRAKFC